MENKDYKDEREAEIALAVSYIHDACRQLAENCEKMNLIGVDEMGNYIIRAVRNYWELVGEMADKNSAH